MIFDPIIKPFKKFGEFIASVVNTTLLAIVYFIGVGVISLVARLFGKHFLEMNSKASSYWCSRGAESKEMNDYYRQF